MDAGASWTVPDVDGKPLRQWDSRGHTTRSSYNAARRPVRVVVTGVDERRPDREIVVERSSYGESLPDAERRNLRGRRYVHVDQSGSAVCHEYDFKGNPVWSTRRAASDYREVIDWSSTNGGDLPSAAEPHLEPTEFQAWSRFDALNRPVLLSTPSVDGGAASTTRYGYNRSNLLDRLDVRIEGDSDVDGAPEWTAVVRAVRYNAKGQRIRLERGNGVVHPVAVAECAFAECFEKFVGEGLALTRRCLRKK